MRGSLAGLGSSGLRCGVGKFNMKTSLRKRADKAKKNRCKNLIAVLENPKTVSNIGSVVRNVDALGIEKLYVIDGNNILPEKWEDMRTNRNLNTISVSAIKWAFVKTFKTTEECVKHLNTKGFSSFGTSPHTKGKVNVSLSDADFTSSRVAVWFGNESMGLTEEALEHCTECIQMDMCGIIESLNLGTATGIVLYEAGRQRRAKILEA